VSSGDLIERDRVKMRKAADSSSGHLIERVKIRGLGVPVPRRRVDWGWEADEEEEEVAMRRRRSRRRCVAACE
jgi:hypothetical protein